MSCNNILICIEQSKEQYTYSIQEIWWAALVLRVGLWTNGARMNEICLCSFIYFKNLFISIYLFMNNYLNMFVKILVQEHLDPICYVENLIPKRKILLRHRLFQNFSIQRRISQSSLSGKHTFWGRITFRKSFSIVRFRPEGEFG